MSERWSLLEHAIEQFPQVKSLRLILSKIPTATLFNKRCLVISLEITDGTEEEIDICGIQVQQSSGRTETVKV